MIGCIIGYEDMNEMLNWRLWGELLGKTCNIVDDGLKGDVRVHDVDYCGCDINRDMVRFA